MRKSKKNVLFYRQQIAYKSAAWVYYKTWYGMDHVTSKPVFGVCDQVRLKPACSATETS